MALASGSPWTYDRASPIAIRVPKPPMNMRFHLRVLSISLLLLAASVATAAPEPATCGDYMNDAAALQTAPHGAGRPTRHVLTVTHQRGVKRFADEPPFQEAFGGAHWYYCAYVPALRAHLIGKNDGDLFSGVLLLDDTGELVDAGQSVYPSPDGELFLAERQASGEDGSRWRVATRSGATRWDGYAGVLTMVTETPGQPPVAYVVTTFDQPHWTERGVLQANAICVSAPQSSEGATLVSVHGTWQWQMNLTCEATGTSSR